nr:hypothetical protein [Candidatus Microthrix sp.]
MELLEGIVGEHCSVGLLGHLENECVPTADDAGGGSNDGPIKHACFIVILLRAGDPMPKCRIHDDRDVGLGMFGTELLNCFIELFQTGFGSPFGCDVGTVNDHM